ncbi:MFS transporter [Mesorhizobium sp. KR9-304]|uniref:MFS transporter n=1 Tax=Mesorhizobium sp. KR9-304 TaxID=3156614 RepID=UPI0032B46E34
MPGIAALAIGYVLSQFYRSFMAVLTPVLTSELGMTKVDLSIASGAWFAVFALAQFAVGVSLDRFGPRRTASVMLAAGAGSGALLFAVASAPWMVIAAMALIGLGCAPILMALLFIFAHNYAPARFAVLASWTIAFGTAGNVIGAAPLAAAAEVFGWRPVIAALGVFTVATAAVLFASVRDPAKPEGSATGSTGLSGFGALLKMRVLWPIIPLAAINYAPTTGIRGLWAGPYLEDVYGLGSLAIGEVTMFMALAMVAGSFLYGPLDTIFKTRKWVAAGGNAVSFLALLCFALNPAPGLFATTILLVVIGLSGSAFGLIMAHARAFVPAHLTGRGVTLMNFFSIGGVGLMQFATGGVVTAWSVPGEPVSGYVALFAFYALMVGLTLLIYLFSRDAKPETTRR